MAKPNRNRKILVAFYVNEAERDEMKKLAQAHDMTFSDYARKTILGKMPNEFKQEQ